MSKQTVRMVELLVVAGAIALGNQPLDLAAAQQPSSATSQPTSITTAQVRTILDAILAAAKKRDPNTVIKHLAPNASVDLTVQSPAGTQRLSLNREQYRQYLQQGFEIAQGYNSQLSNLKVQVDSTGKQAIATYTLLETVNLNQPAVIITSSTDATVRFQLVQGQILATQIKSVSTVEVNPN